MAESWIQFLNRFYKEKRAKNPSYKYKQAMVDASRVFKKQDKSGSSGSSSDASSVTPVVKKTKKRRGGKGSKKSRKSKM
jgi:hypothetical protein